ncbi:MAG: bifunctional nuclease family protein [Chloroflexi bacterium]|nr:bifunctional nuclease family protein [Chloroflexota bacterium]
MIEMTIDSIRVSVTNYQRVVILKDKTHDRYLPIWIGPSEADAIAVKLQDVSVPRPLTHDLLRSIIGALGATVVQIVVCDLKNDTFFAKIHLQVNGKSLEIDSRPSDAMALAVRVSAPIFVDESVMEKAGILLDKETGKAIPQAQKAAEAGEKPVGEEELKRLSAFKDFIQELNLEDLDKGKEKS